MPVLDFAGYASSVRGRQDNQVDQPACLLNYWEEPPLPKAAVSLNKW